MTEQALGALLLQLPGAASISTSRRYPWLRVHADRISLVLEIYTEPLLTDSTQLDAYVSTFQSTLQSNRSPHA